MEKVTLNPAMIEAAKIYLKNHDIIHEVVELECTSADNNKAGPKFVLSSNHNNIVSLHMIIHKETKYYIGLPKSK